MYFGLTPISSKMAESDYDKFKEEVEILVTSVWDSNSYNTLNENDYLGFVEKKNQGKIVFYKIEKIIDCKLNEKIRRKYGWEITEKKLKRNILRLEAVDHKPCYWCEKNKIKLNYGGFTLQGTMRLARFGDQTLEKIEDIMT